MGRPKSARQGTPPGPSLWYTRNSRSSFASHCTWFSRPRSRPEGGRPATSGLGSDAFSPRVWPIFFCVWPNATWSPGTRRKRCTHRHSRRSSRKPPGRAPRSPPLVGFGWSWLRSEDLRFWKISIQNKNGRVKKSRSYLDLPIYDDVQPLRGVALPENVLPAPELDLFELVDDIFDGLIREDIRPEDVRFEEADGNEPLHLELLLEGLSVVLRGHHRKRGLLIANNRTRRDLVDFEIRAYIKGNPRCWCRIWRKSQENAKNAETRQRWSQHGTKSTPKTTTENFRKMARDLFLELRD